MPARRSAFSVDVIGLRDFQKELRNLGPEWPRELRAANKQVAELVAEEARARVPVLSGRLKKSIKAQAQTRSSYVKAGTNARVPYALPIEFGWPSRNIQAQPFIYPAIAAKSDEVVEAYGDAVDEVADRAFPRVGS